MLLAIFRIIGISARAVNDFLDKNGPHLAAAVSYYAVCSLFPLSLAILSGLSFILGPDAVDGLAVRIAEQAPVSNQAVSEALSSIVGSRSIAGLTGIIGLLWAGSAVFGALTRMMNRIWNLEDNRKFFKKKIMDVLYIIILGSVFFLTISIEILYGTLGNYIGIEGAGDSEGTSNFLETGWTWTTINILPPLLSFGLFSFIYTIIPQRKIKLRDSLVGATLGMLVFEYSKSLFVLYIYNFGNFDKVYGSISAVIILLLFSYVTSIIIVFFAEISYVYTTMREEGTFKFTSK